MLPADPPDQLEGFPVADAGHGAGVDQVRVRVTVHRDGFPAAPEEQFEHCLRIILVDFTAQRMGGDGFHHCSISPYRHISAAIAAGPAVSVRRIRLPSVTGMNPAASRPAISAADIPPSGPISTPMDFASGCAA